MSTHNIFFHREKNPCVPFLPGAMRVSSDHILSMYGLIWAFAVHK